MTITHALDCTNVACRPYLFVKFEQDFAAFTLAKKLYPEAKQKFIKTLCAGHAAQSIGLMVAPTFFYNRGGN